VRGFGFRTVPDYPPESEWLVVTAVLCLYLPITVIVIAVAPIADPLIRLLAIYVAWWFAALAVAGMRWRLARARGVPFVSDWDYAQVYFRWGVAEPLWVQGLRMLPFLVVVLIAVHSGVYGVQFWELPLRSWQGYWTFIPVLAVTLPMMRWRKRPPRLSWPLYALLAVSICALYLNGHPNPTSAAVVVGLITPVVVARYWISRVT
jgi:hypothetical protein